MPQVSVLRITRRPLHFQMPNPLSRKQDRVRANGLSPRRVGLFAWEGVLGNWITGQHWATCPPKTEHVQEKWVLSILASLKGEGKGQAGWEWGWVSQALELCANSSSPKNKWFSHNLLLTDTVLFYLFSPGSWVACDEGSSSFHSSISRVQWEPYGPALPTISNWYRQLRFLPQTSVQLYLFQYQLFSLWFILLTFFLPYFVYKWESLNSNSIRSVVTIF